MYFILIFLLYLSRTPAISTYNLNLVTSTSYVNSNATIGTLYEGEVDSNYPHLYEYQWNIRHKSLRLYFSSILAETSYPILVVVRRRKDVMSWQIPLTLNNNKFQYWTVNRTLCSSDDDDDGNILSVPESIVVEVSTSSSIKIDYQLRLYEQRVFEISNNESYEATLTPSSPIYFRYNWKRVSTMGISLIKIRSSDNLCAIVSVQDLSCPVYDSIRSVQFQGSYQTMDQLTGITVTQDQYPDGFFLVFVVEPEDTVCSGYVETSPSSKTRIKNLEFQIVDKISENEYLIAITGTLMVFGTIYLFVFFLYLYSNWRNRSSSSGNVGPLLAEDYYDNERYDFAVVGDEEDEEGEEEENHVEEAIGMGPNMETAVLFVSDLARKRPEVLAKKSDLYRWNLLTVALFYGLPAVQFVVTYQRAYYAAGNEDSCYYNFLCATPLSTFIFTDFNHVFSNVGYVALGFLFWFIAWKKDRAHRYAVMTDRTRDTEYGIPRHFGIYYAMAIALVMEGIMSACYHVCPNHTNFQFDTAFMYTISILILLKIYQARHPDINASAYTAFGVLAFVILVGLFGVLEEGNLYFWIVFATIHVVASLLLSIQIYYMGRWRLNSGIFRRIYRMLYADFKALMTGNWRRLKPIYPYRMILLVIVNAVNWSLDVFGLTSLPDVGESFASFLLTILIANVLLYTFFYILMKLRHKEKIQKQTVVYIFVSMFTWIGAMYFFIDKSTTWSSTAAHSRRYNQDCKILNFYDNHDIWHFLSAASLFLSFMILLTLDEELRTVKRNEIPVF